MKAFVPLSLVTKATYSADVFPYELMNKDIGRYMLDAWMEEWKEMMMSI